MQDYYSETDISKNPAIAVLERLGYLYIGIPECKKQRGSQYKVLLKDILRNKLKQINKFEYAGVKREFSSANIERAIEDLDMPLTEGLVRTNEKIYHALMLGRSYPEEVGEGKVLNFDLNYIDWQDINKNIFHVTEEFLVTSADGQHKARPDIVLFVNGIPFGVIECKTSYISINQGIQQMLRNQQADMIPQLFKFTQILMVTNKNTVKYATTGTPERFWSSWIEEDTDFLEENIEKYIEHRVPTKQDKDLISLFKKERLMAFVQYFILFDANVKKISRHQQFFAVKEILNRIAQEDEKGNRKGGVIWHTQGSGKSLTMVMIAKYILFQMRKQSPKIILVSDRKELDKQIAKTFLHTDCKPARATSGKNLIQLIEEGKADIITTVIHKFNKVESSGLKSYAKDIFVLVDESHRTNYGELATKMRVVFPNACYIGFTGTPLMKKEKNTMRKFGRVIHKYTISDAVKEGEIVPLIYEGRFVEQRVDEENIDLWFEETTKRLNEKQKVDLKRKWSTLKRITSTDARIKRIALDINHHFINTFKETGFKAMLATNRKRDAVAYLKCFEQFRDLKCAVCISAPDMREGVTDIDETGDDSVVAFWKKMMERYGNADAYEDSVKSQFLDGDIDILIVCGKLLTGFDAPRCQVIYIDRELAEHNLLQAIARTNRLYDGKDYGLIVDYRGLVEKLDEAMGMYSGAGLENFDSVDLKGVMTDVMTQLGEVRQAYTHLITLFNSLTNNRDCEEVEVFLADSKIREDFYKLLCVFGKKLSIILNSEVLYQEIPNEERLKYQEAFIFYSKVRRTVKIRYNDIIDNAEYEPLMQNLLDTHLSVAGLKRITPPIDIMNQKEFNKQLDELGSLRSKAEAIQFKMTKSISEKRLENPAYYDRFSKRIKDTLEKYKEKRMTDAEYFEAIYAIMQDYVAGRTDIEFPEKIQNNTNAQAFYSLITSVLEKEAETADKSAVIRENSEYLQNIQKNVLADISIDITRIIEEQCRVDWINNNSIHDRMAQEIDDLFYEYEKEGKCQIPLPVVDKIIENIKLTASRRYKK